MANKETQILDNIISSRRAMLLGGAALTAAALVPQAKAATTVTSYTDNDILNFALNLEYLEANFYYLAAFGTTIDNPTAASAALGGPTAAIAINGVTGTGATTTQGAGVRASFGTATNVPFLNAAVQAYAVETAIEEGKHVSFLRSALGSTFAVAQPAIDVSPAGAFTALAQAAKLPVPYSTLFNPYASDAAFLIGAYVFEDVGVTAYHGASGLVKSTSLLSAAASILAVEAYHAGLIRTTIGALDPINANGYIGLTQQISLLRSQLSLAANTAVTTPDDNGLAGPGLGTPVSIYGTSVQASRIVDADANVVAFARNTTQVLNIVTGGGATTAGTAAKGVFFPSGMNGLFS